MRIELGLGLEHEPEIGLAMVLVHFAFVDLELVPVEVDLVAMDYLPFGYHWHSSSVDVGFLGVRIGSSESDGAICQLHVYMDVIVISLVHPPTWILRLYPAIRVRQL